jgi:hypothetical protein
MATGRLAGILCEAVTQTATQAVPRRAAWSACSMKTDPGFRPWPDQRFVLRVHRALRERPIARLSTCRSRPGWPPHGEQGFVSIAAA